MKDFRVFVGALLFSGFLIAILAFWFGGGFGSENKVLGEVSGMEVSPASYDLGNVPIKGGLVGREYEVKNVTDKTIKLKKITTSCMCTQAKAVVGGKETKFFGMEMASDRNPTVNLEIGPGEAGKVLVTFDPAAHGPTGTGPFDRAVQLTFSDPAGIKEIKFSGVVVSQ